MNLFDKYMIPKISYTLIVCYITLTGLLCSCEKSPEAKLDTARMLLDEHPDSAYQLLREVDYSDFNEDSLKSKFILTKAMANTKTGRTLITDSLLDDAVQFYDAAGDTVNWAIATQSLASHIFLKGDNDRALRLIDDIIARSHDPHLLWEAHYHRLELSWAAQDYHGAYAHADWLSKHTDRPEQIIRMATIKSASRYMQGQFNEAVAIQDSIIASSILDKIDKSEQESFYCDYAEMLDGAGRSAEAIEVLQKVIDNSESRGDVEIISRISSMALFYTNIGNTAKAKALLDNINHEATISVFEIYASIAMLEAAIQYKETGHFPSEMMHRVTKAIDLNHRFTQYDRHTAMKSVVELNDDKYELRLQKQRLWLVIFGITIVLLAGSVAVFLILNRRRQRLIEAEEKVEALTLMLKDAEKAETDKNNSSDNAKLKAALLHQLGILKTFAGAPTQQSRDALRKISSVGSGDESIGALVDWPGFYAMIDELYDNFRSKLIKTYPDTFNDKEQQIIVLLKSGFSTKEISVLTEQSSATIYVRKTAIRKKLHTPENGDFIAQLDAQFATSESH